MGSGGVGKSAVTIQVRISGDKMAWTSELVVNEGD